MLIIAEWNSVRASTITFTDSSCKPFDVGKLVACSKGLIRRGAVLKVADLEISTADLTVRRGGQPVPLAAMEYRVLEYLARRAGAVVSKTELLENLYDYNWERFSNVIEGMSGGPAISKAIIEAYGRSITAKSEAGIGTRMIVSIPKQS